MMRSGDQLLRMTKGAEEWELTEQIRISPLPKLAGIAGGQLRFLSVTRGQSVVTALEQGSFAQIRRRIGLPLMHRIWFHPEGHSLGYTKKQKIGNPSDLFFLDGEARVLCHRQLPDAASEVASGPGQWYVGCRNGEVYAFALEGAPLWNDLVPYLARDRSINAELGLPVSHPYLNLAAGGRGVVIGSEVELCVYHPFGHQISRWPLPPADGGIRRCGPIDVPLHDERLGRLGLSSFGTDYDTRTGYLRLALSTERGDTWVKQTEAFEHPDDPVRLPESPLEDGFGDPVVNVVVPFPSLGIHVVRSTWHSIFVGTRDGLLHTFSHDGEQLRTFQLGPDPVKDILADHNGLKAAYSGGRLTVFDGQQITGSVILPQHFADLTFCGEWVLAWRWKSAWLVGGRGQVLWAGQTEKPILAAWGDVGGFCLLAGQLLSIRGRKCCLQ